MKLPQVSDRVYLGSLVAIAFGLRAAGLERGDLWTDEIQTLHAVQLPVADLVAERLHAGHVPVYFLVLKGWSAAFGTSQFALRLPSALFGTALLVPAWSLLRRLGGVGVARWGAAILAVHPLLVELSREARMYSLLAFLALLVADRAAASLEGEAPGPRFWAAAALGPFVHPTWGLAMLPLSAWLVGERRAAAGGPRRKSAVALGGIVASLAVLGIALAFAAPQHQELTRRPWPREAVVFVLRMFAGSDLRIFRSALACVSVGLYWGLFLFVGYRRAPPRARRLAMWWAAGVPVASVAAGALGGVPWGPARYVEMAAVGFATLAAEAASSLDRPRRWQSPLFVVVVFVTSLGPILAPSTAWSAAAAELGDDPTPVVVDDESSRIVLAHYLGREVFVGEAPHGATSFRHAALDPDPADDPASAFARGGHVTIIPLTTR